MVTPFRSNPFEQQTQQFLAQLRSQEEQQRRDREARAARRRDIAIRNAKIRQEQLDQEILEKYQAPPIEEPLVQQGTPIYDQPTPPEPAVIKGVDVSGEEPFQFTGGFAPGLRSNIANAGITALGAIEPALNTAIGLGSRILPGEQEFDKQLRQVMEEREEQGKPAGVRQFFAASAEAARRAQPATQGAKNFSSWLLPWLDIARDLPDIPGPFDAFSPPFIAGEFARTIPDETFDRFQKLREQYYEEETGQKLEDSGLISNFTADIRASRRAYDEIDLPKYYKGTLEVVLDPINLVPGAGWINDAKFIQGAALSAGRAAVLSPQAVRAIPKLPSRLKETWNAASEIPAKNLDELQAKQNAGQVIIDESNPQAVADEIKLVRRNSANKKAEFIKQIKIVKKANRPLKQQIDKAVSSIEKIDERIRVLRNEARRKGTSAARKASINSTLLPSLRREKQNIKSSRKESLSQLALNNDQINELDRSIKQLPSNIETPKAVKDLAEAQAGERTTTQVYGHGDYVDSVITGKQAEENVAQGARYYNDVDETTEATKRAQTSNSLFGDANDVMKESQGGSFKITVLAPAAVEDMDVAQKLGYRAGQLLGQIPGSSKTPNIPTEIEVNLQDVIRGSFNKLPESIQMPLGGVARAITPRLLANLEKVNLATERIKFGIINARLQSTAATVVNRIIAKTGSSSQVFGDALESGSIINVGVLDADNAASLTQKIRRRLSSRYSETTDLSPSQIREALNDVEAGKFHESDLLNAVVEVRQYINAKGVTELVYDLADEFKVGDNVFWQDGKLTRQSHYFVQRAKAYGEFAKLLEEAGIPVRVALNGTTIALSGAARVRHLLSDGAFASRYVWARKSGTGRVADGGFEKYYNKARTLIDPDELLARVQDGSVSYVSPEDTLAIYSSAVYKQIADTALEERLIKIFRENPELAKKYNVVVKADIEPSLKGGESFVQIGGAGKESGYRTLKDVKYKLEKSGEVVSDSRTSRERLFDGLLFNTPEQAAKFAQDFDVLLESAEFNPFIQRFKHWLTTSKVSRTAADFTRILRLGGTGIDIGLLAIYGPIIMGKGTSDILKGLAKNDSTLLRQGQNIYKGLANATVDSFISLARPDQVLARTYRPERQELLRKANVANLHLSRVQVEAYEALNSNGPFSNWLSKPTPNVNWPSRGKNALASTLNRFQGSWSTFIDEVKLSTFDALTGHLKMEVAEEAEQIRRIADFINKGTGTLSSEAVGLTNFQRHIESTFLFFSPRMTRSMIALLSDGITRGGVEGRLARESVITAHVALQAYTWGIGQVLGQDVNLDPTKPHYMQIKIGDDWVGPGGQIISLFRAGTRLIAGAGDEASVYQDFNEDGGYKDNEWFKLIRGRALSAPAGSAIADFILEEDFYGVPYDGFKDIAMAQAKKALPFWLQDAVSADPYRAGVGATAAAFAGLRTRPLTPYERSRDLRNQAVEQKYGAEGFTNYQSLDPVRKKELNKELNSGSSSSISASVLRDYQAIEEIIEEVRESADVDSVTVNDFYEELESVRAKSDSAKADVFRKLETLPGQTKADVRLSLSRISQDFSSEYEAIFDKSENGTFADVHEFLDRLQNVKGTERKEEVWINSYFETILFSPEFEKVTEEGVEYFDYAAFEGAKRTWLSRYGADAYNYVQEYLDAGKDIHPVEKELIITREKYGYNYWQAPKLAAIEQTAMKFGVSIAEVERLYEQWNTGTVETKSILGKAEIIKAVKNSISAIRKSMRENDQGLDGFLFGFGYTNTLVHPLNADVSARAVWRTKQAHDEDFYNSFDVSQ